MADFINGLSDIIDRYDHFIIDIWGVLHNGLTLFPHTVSTLEQLRAAGKTTCLLSNSPRRAYGAADQMARMGLPRDAYDHIVTSGEETHLLIKTGQFGLRALFHGTPVMHEVLEDTDITLVHTPQDADFILNAAPDVAPHFKYDFLNELRKCADHGLPMICSNPDLVVNIGAEQYECAGTFAKFYEDRGGNVTYIGKPYAPVYERCHTLLGAPDKDKICAIGDSFHTDITGANNFGIASIFNITGVHEHEVLGQDGQLCPTRTQSLIAKNNMKPNYLMNGLSF